MPPQKPRDDKEFKSILVKNLLRSIHVLARDLSSLFPVVISFSYISTTLNLADANSKYHNNPSRSLILLSGDKDTIGFLIRTTPSLRTPISQ